jgi:hypothetical protein
MSQSNQITPQDPSQNPTPKKGNSIIYWVVILILLTACVYLFVDRNRKTEDMTAAIKQETQKYDSLSTDRVSLQADFDAASAKIDQLVSQNSKLDSALQGDKAGKGKYRAYRQEQSAYQGARLYYRSERSNEKAGFCIACFEYPDGSYS